MDKLSSESLPSVSRYSWLELNLCFFGNFFFGKALSVLNRSELSSKMRLFGL